MRASNNVRQLRIQRKGGKLDLTVRGRRIGQRQADFGGQGRFEQGISSGSGPRPLRAPGR